ncbi:MAG: hypothetical protein JXB30_08930 [Anaerolineae bacterium]|nr:hypothetical protein [Anaerolineae bacterium]
MKRFLIGLTVLIVLSLTACSSPTIEREFTTAAEATLQNPGFSSTAVHVKNKPTDPDVISSSLEIVQTEDTDGLTGMPTSMSNGQEAISTPAADGSNQQENHVPSPTPPPITLPTSTPLPPPTSTPLLPPTSTPLPPSPTPVLPTPTFFALGGTEEIRVSPLEFSPQSSIVDRNTTFNFGVSFRFINTSEHGISLIAFPRYADETVTSTTTGCMTGTMPSSHPDRPFWSTGTDQIYAPGEHSFSQTFTYSEPIPDSTHLELWVLARQGGQVRYCAQRLYRFSP